jgi:hypothetical protein
MSLARFEPTIPASNWLQALALDRSATGISERYVYQMYVALTLTYTFLTMVLHE